MNTHLKIGLVGFGCVGSGLYEVLNKSGLLGATIKTIVVKHPEKKRSLPKEAFSYEVKDILDDPEINVVVELINDSVAAYELVKRAFKAGKHVVSANKKLIAEHLDELLALATENQVSFLYEGAVAGSIPIIRNLEEYYNNDSLTSVEGITNGTTNYILTQSNFGVDYASALAQAQELGFAEADPTLDVDGFDSKFKLVLLIKHAFGLSVEPNQLHNIGIRRITEKEIAYATEKGFRIKLLSRAEKIGQEVCGFVAPHFVDRTHPAFEVNNEFNAVIVQGLFSDRQLFLGKGAGSYPTASAVLSDISALKFDYRYEYRKSDAGKNLQLSEQFYLNVYIGTPHAVTLEEAGFEEVYESFRSRDYAYKTGLISFEKLAALQTNAREDLAVIVLPGALQKPELVVAESANVEFNTH
jgi:homoserine dehydrogenase